MRTSVNTCNRKPTTSKCTSTTTKKSTTSSSSSSTTSGTATNKTKPPIQFKRGTSKAFRKENPILVAGQPAYEMDTHKLKVGDGVTRWRQLPYVSNGDKGDTGKSAYEVWLDAGNEGTVSDFLTAIQGESAYEVWLAQGNDGDEDDFFEAIRGKSAYEVWLAVGHDGNEEDFFDYIKGASAYDQYVEAGGEMTLQEFTISLLYTVCWGTF